MIKESNSSHCFFAYNRTLSMRCTWTVTHRNAHALYDIVCLNHAKSLALGGDQVKGNIYR